MTMKADPQDRSLPPAVIALVERVREQNPMHRNFLSNALARLSPEEMQHLELYLEFCDRRGLSSDYLAQCYLTIVGDTLSEQVLLPGAQVLSLYDVRPGSGQCLLQSRGP